MVMSFVAPFFGPPCRLDLFLLTAFYAQTLTYTNLLHTFLHTLGPITHRLQYNWHSDHFQC